MALKDTVNRMKMLLCEICDDLEKAEKGNRTASQRVRTSSIKLEKVAKMYRKESVAAEKKEGGKKVKAASSKKNKGHAAAKGAKHTKKK